MKVEFNPTGVVRTIDDLGRIVIPRDLRINTGIQEGTRFEIFVDKNGNIYMKKLEINNKERWFVWLLLSLVRNVDLIIFNIEIFSAMFLVEIISSWGAIEND